MSRHTGFIPSDHATPASYRQITPHRHMLVRHAKLTQYRCTRIQIHIEAYTDEHTHTHMCLDTHTNACKHTRMYACMQAHTHARTPTNINQLTPAYSLVRLRSESTFSRASFQSYLAVPLLDRKSDRKLQKEALSWGKLERSGRPRTSSRGFCLLAFSRSTTNSQLPPDAKFCPK